MNKIDTLLPSSERTVCEKSIHETVNKIQDRHGSLGLVRKQTIAYLTKVIIEKVTPSHIRYLLFAAMQNNGYFEKARGRKLVKKREKKESGDSDDNLWAGIIQAVGLNEQ